MTKKDLITRLSKVATKEAKDAVAKLSIDANAFTSKQIEAMLPIEASVKETTPVEEKKAPAQPKKALKKKTVSKKEETPLQVKVAKSTTKAKSTKAKAQVIEEVEMFPNVINFEGAKLQKVETFTMKELKKAYDEERVIYIATHWTPDQLKQFDYAGDRNVKCPRKFENNLDITQVAFICENNPKTYAISIITEACFEFTDEDLLSHNQVGMPLSVYLEKEEA